MEIGSVGSLSSYASISQASRPESAEQGPDRDHDGDEGSKAVTTESIRPSSTTGRGLIVNILA